VAGAEIEGDPIPLLFRPVEIRGVAVLAVFTARSRPKKPGFARPDLAFPFYHCVAKPKDHLLAPLSSAERAEPTKLWAG